jgi:hypothetical protein
MHAVVKGSMSLSEDPREREEGALLRLLRAAIGKQGEGLSSVDEETLTAYVMGTANPAQSAAVHTALTKSADFRRQVLDLMQISAGSFTAKERQAFEQATAPSLEEVRKLASLGNELEQQVAAPAAPAIMKPVLRRGWLEWALGGWAVTATVAACGLFVVMSRSTSVGPRPPRIQTPSGAVGPKQPPSPFTLGVVETITLRGMSRSAAPEALPSIRVGPSTRIIELVAEPPDVPDSSTVRVTLTAADGRLLVDEMHPVEDFSGRRALAIQSQVAFWPGQYLLTIAGQRGSLREEVSYPFAIKVDAR